MRPIRTSTAGVPKTASSATATTTTARDGPIAATPPERKAWLSSARVMSAASTARIAAAM